MFTSRDKLAIVLAPEHLSMATVRAGEIVQAERVDLDPSQWDETWSGGLHKLDQPLRQLLARFGGIKKSVRADLFYTSPGSVCRVEVSDLDQSTSVAKMESGLKQSIGLANPVDSACLFSDCESSLTVGISDDESNLQKLFAWMNRSRVTVGCMVPSKVFDIQLAMNEASAVEEGTTILYLSDRSSVIGYFEGGSPKIARLVDIGYNKLSDAYSRTATLNCENAQSGGAIKGQVDSVSALSSDANQQNPGSSVNGEEMLFLEGIPIYTERDSSRFAGVMPAMSPVLQRISIEIKQTFRFARSIERSPSKLVICGPGAAIPKIGSALAQSLDMHVEITPAAKGYKPTEIFGEGTSIRAAACSKNKGLELIPGAVTELRKQAVLGRALKAGVAAVIVLIGAQYYYTEQQTTKAQNVLSDQSHVIDRIDLDGERRESIRIMAGSIGTAAGLIEDTMGNRVQWVGFLSSMPNESHSLIRISDLQGRMNGLRPMINLTGTAFAESEKIDASQVLSRYIKSLRDMPEVKRIEIGSTSRSLMDESVWGLNFILAVEISSERGQFSELTALCDTEHGVSK